MVVEDNTGWCGFVFSAFRASEFTIRVDAARQVDCRQPFHVERFLSLIIGAGASTRSPSARNLRHPY
jgi:hypothetical protein